nr:RecName: Full=Ribosome-inactivating protein pleuturegin; AltName: Full=rRNA N-glycosidase [Pleurotus tuber-regium]
ARTQPGNIAPVGDFTLYPNAPRQGHIVA